MKIKLSIFIVVLMSVMTAHTQRKLPDVTLSDLNGRPVIMVDGQPMPMSGYSPMTWDKIYTQRAMPRFYPHKMGFYLISVPPVANDFFATPFWVGNDVFNRPSTPSSISKNAYNSVDEPVQEALNGDKDARIMIRFGLYEPQSWAKLHKEEYFIADDGTVQTAPSLASDAYWDIAAKTCYAIVNYCESRPWADKVIGYANFHRNEGTYEPAISGWLYDHSPMMTSRWRSFLEKKYLTIDKLQIAWGDKTVNEFSKVEIPTDPLRGNTPVVAKSLYWQEALQNQRMRDYIELQRELFHQRFQQLSSAMYKGTDRKMIFLHDALKQTMQGWDIDEFFGIETPRSLADVEVMSASGHMDVAKLFNIPGCDGLITPHDYQTRGTGGIFEPEGIVDSAVLRGKLFLCEMDTRTYMDKYNAYGSSKNINDFKAITWRNLATGLTRGFWPYWMDLSADWFSDPAMAPVIARQNQVIKDSLQWKHDTVPGIAVIIDDKSVLETNGSGNYLNEAIMWQIRGGLSRCGVPYRIYLFEDLALPNFPAHKVFYFPNLFKADDARIALLKEKIFRDGNVVVWGPGSGIADGIAGAERLTGFKFEMIKANFPHKVLISNFTHPITMNLPADTMLGSPLSYGPLLFPVDGTELGIALTKQGRNIYGLSVKSFGKGAGSTVNGKPLSGQGNYASVFTHALPLPADLWRNIAAYSGTHVYCNTNDLILADSSVVALHSMQSGKKILTLPGKFNVYDIVTGKCLMKKVREIKFTLNAPETRIFHLVPAKSNL